MKLPGRFYIYFIGQSINLTVAVMSVAIATIVGMKYSPNPNYATLPYGFQFLLVLLSSYPISWIMQKYSRKVGFAVGGIALALAGIIGYYAVILEEFILLFFAHGLIGVYIGSANFNRFAVTDYLHDDLKAKAMSMVVAGGVVAGIIAPVISGLLSKLENNPDFSLNFLALTALAMLCGFILLFIPNETEIKDSTVTSLDIENQAIINASPDIGWRNISLKVPLIILLTGIGYFFMNLLMMQTLIFMNANNSDFNDINLMLQGHVLAMFIPSFFTGHIITKIGSKNVILIGFIIYIISFIINIFFTSFEPIFFSMILLGIAWNFTYVGGSSYLAKTIEEHPAKIKWQGIGDTGMAAFATLGATIPGFLQGMLGWNDTNIIMIIIACISLAMVLIFLTNFNKQI